MAHVLRYSTSGESSTLSAASNEELIPVGNSIQQYLSIVRQMVQLTVEWGNPKTEDEIIEFLDGPTPKVEVLPPVVEAPVVKTPMVAEKPMPMVSRSLPTTNDRMSPKAKAKGKKAPARKTERGFEGNINWKAFMNEHREVLESGKAITFTVAEVKRLVGEQVAQNARNKSLMLRLKSMLYTTAATAGYKSTCAWSEEVALGVDVFWDKVDTPVVE